MIRQYLSRCRVIALVLNNMGVYAQINDVIKEQYELVLAGKTTVNEMAKVVQVQGEKLMAAQ